MNQHNRNLPGNNDMQDVSSPDVAKMSPADIQREIDKLMDLKAQREKSLFNDALQDINNIIKTKLKIDGVSNVHELSAFLQKDDAVKLVSKNRQRRAVSHYWQHRTDPSLQWTGRGQVIRWLRDEMIEAGKDPSDKEEVKKYCTDNLDFISNNGLSGQS